MSMPNGDHVLPTQRLGFGRLLLRILIIAALLLIPAALIAWRILELSIGALLAILFGIAGQVGALTDQALNATYLQLQQNPAVVELIGEPMTFPTLQEIEWVERAPNDPPDQIICRFFIVGPKREAQVTARLVGDNARLRVMKMEIAPVDGGAPLEMDLPPP